MVDVVIARYNEDITWTQKLHYNVIIYNKGSELANSIRLPNIGREAHTYIHHIVENYDTMDPNGVTAFSQGMLSDRLNGKPEHAYIVELVEEARQKGFSESKAYWHNLIPIHQPHENFRILEWPEGIPLTPNTKNENLGQWFRRCMNVAEFPNPSDFKWVIGAIFAVKNNKILSRNKQFYLDLLNEFDDSTAPEMAHFFERSWYFIFNAHVK